MGAQHQGVSHACPPSWLAPPCCRAHGARTAPSPSACGPLASKARHFLLGIHPFLASFLPADGTALLQIFPVAKRLADCVVPAEYGIAPDYKLRIGKKIASELIGKLLADLENSSRDCDVPAHEVAGIQHPAAPSESSGVHGSGDEVLSSQVRPARLLTCPTPTC